MRRVASRKVVVSFVCLGGEREDPPRIVREPTLDVTNPHQTRRSPKTRLFDLGTKGVVVRRWMVGRVHVNTLRVIPLGPAVALCYDKYHISRNVPDVIVDSLG